MTDFKKADILNFRQLFFLDEFLLGHNGFIAGGCFKNIFNNEPVKDIDVFFENNADFLQAKRVFKQLITEHPDKWSKSYRNAKVYAVYSKKHNIRIELIRSVFGTPEQILKDFDFTVTKFAYYVDKSLVDPEDYMAQFQVMYHEDYFEHLQMKRLVLDANIPFPISTFNRSYKYTGYGYNLCRESKAKLLTAINELPVLDERELGLSLYEGKD